VAGSIGTGILLHGLNELYQRFTWQGKYQNKEHFKKDSKKDWKQFLIGMFIIVPVTTLIWIWMS
jgi:hypothetical protein